MTKENSRIEAYAHDWPGQTSFTRLASRMDVPSSHGHVVLSPVRYCVVERWSKFTQQMQNHSKYGHQSIYRTKMHSFRCEAVIVGDPDAVWRVWTDVARWPEWDSSKEFSRLDGPFAVGTSGWAKQRGNLGGPFTITKLDPGCSWTAEAPFPLGKVVFTHALEPLSDGRVRVAKIVEVYGGFASLFQLVLTTKMRQDVARSFISLERQAKELNDL